MITRVVKALLHLTLSVVCSASVLWVLFYLHGTGLNSGLIPDSLRWENGVRNRLSGLWLGLSCAISYTEWFCLLWLVNKFNRWYGPEWLDPAQMWLVSLLTILEAGFTAVCIAIFYWNLRY